MKAVGFVIKRKITAITMMITATTMKMIPAIEDLTSVTAKKILAVITMTIAVIEDLINVIVKKTIAVDMMKNAVTESLTNAAAKKILAAAMITIITIQTDADATATIIAAAEKTASIRLMSAKLIAVIGSQIHGDADAKFHYRLFRRNRMIAAATETAVIAATITIMTLDCLIYTITRKLQWLMYRGFILTAKMTSTICAPL